MTTLDSDVCGMDFSDEVRDILRRRESWERWSQAISQREDILRERMEAWSNYRKILENYSMSNNQELRSFAETMGSYYEEQVRRLVEKRVMSTTGSNMTMNNLESTGSNMESTKNSMESTMNSIKTESSINELRQRLSKWQEYRQVLNTYSEETTTQIKTIVDQITTKISEEIMRREMNMMEESRTVAKQGIKEEKKVETTSSPPIAPYFPSPPQAPPEKSDADAKFERIEASTYRFMSKLLDLVDYNFKQFSQTTVIQWSVESRMTQEFYQTFLDLRQELSSTEVTRLDSVKTLSDKAIMCARLGRTDFQSLATVNDELSKFKNNYKFSSKNQAASQWASDWMMRMDLTLKKSMNSQSQISSHSSSTQRQFFDMRRSSLEHNSVVSWSLMRSEELLSKAEKTGQVDMDSVKAIVKSSMKISDIQSSETSSWLRQVDESTSSSSMWTSREKSFWSESSFEQIQSQKSSFSSSFESLSTISTM